MILAGIFVVVLITVLVILWLLFIFNTRFRDHMNSAGDDYIPMTRPQFHKNNNREFYLIWIGRILDIVSVVTGSEKKTLGREHYISVIFWVFVIAGVSGYFSGFFSTDFSLIFIVMVLIISILYAGQRAGRTPPDPEEMRPGNI
jgi:uncharacterized membrane protein